MESIQLIILAGQMLPWHSRRVLLLALSKILWTASAPPICAQLALAYGTTRSSKRGAWISDQLLRLHIRCSLSQKSLVLHCKSLKCSAPPAWRRAGYACL